MSKQILRFSVQVMAAFIAVFFSHQYLLNIKSVTLSYSLMQVYLFYAIAALLVYAVVVIVAKKLPSQAGYAFLAMVFLKIGFFVVLFSSVLFTEARLPMLERVSLIIPFFMFLGLEAIQITKLLNKE